LFPDLSHGKTGPAGVKFPSGFAKRSLVHRGNLGMKEQPVRKTMLKKEEWGGLTLVALFAAYAFPPYFVYLMTMAALTEFAHLWTTRLSRIDQEKFIEFEKEFRKGYKLEKAGRRHEALKWYQKLERRYRDLPQAEKLATLQIRSLTRKEKGRSGTPPKAPPPPAKPPEA
jgi:hypothetical protein